MKSTDELRPAILFCVGQRTPAAYLYNKVVSNGWTRGVGRGVDGCSERGGGEGGRGGWDFDIPARGGCKVTQNGLLQ